MTFDFAKRRRAVLGELRRRGLDCLLVVNPANWYYLTGFTGEAGALVLSSAGSTLITDGRFTIQAGEEAPGIRVELQRGSLFGYTGEFLQRRGFRRVGFDPRHLTIEQWNALRRRRGGKWKGIVAGGIVEGLRMRKDAAELAVMRKAAILASEVMEHAVAQLRPGVRESEIAAEIEFQMRRRGASGASFETIVASGARSALPHARPTAKKLRKNELVVLDLGAILAHYCSDMTRTVYLGRAPRRVREWYAAVQEAEQAGIAAVEAGVACGAVDEAARSVLRKHKLEGYFVHSTGHGLGLEVHEDPRVARGQEIRLEAGTAITIEPGVYVEGAGGIRIEDDVVAGARGREVLTRVRRDLIEI